MRKKVLISFILIILPFSISEAASIRLDNVIVHFENGTKSKKDIEVSNTSQETAYVEVTVYEVVNPGEDNEETRVVTDPKNISLLVSPNKTIIPPNGRSFLRLVNLSTPKDKERIFRLKVAPVEGEGQAHDTGVRLLIAYGVLVIVEPENPMTDLVYSREGKVITFSNNGNSNILLSNGMLCKEKTQEDEKENCEKLQSKRLYAGNKWSLTLPFEGKVTFNKITRLSNESLVIEKN